MKDFFKEINLNLNAKVINIQTNTSQKGKKKDRMNNKQKTKY